MNLPETAHDPPVAAQAIPSLRIVFWLGSAIFFLVFVFYAVLYYTLLSPQFIDLPELDRLAARVRLDELVEVERQWLREHEWNWPLGGQVFVLPGALEESRLEGLNKSAQTNGMPEQPPCITRWWMRLLGTSDSSEIGSSNPIQVLLNASPDFAHGLSDALRDFGPLLVSFEDARELRQGVLIGDFSSDDNRLVLIASPSPRADGIRYYFASPAQVRSAWAYPHPLKARWKQIDEKVVQLEVRNSLGKPVRLELPTELKLNFDGQFRAGNEEGTYLITPGPGVPRKNRSVQIRHPYQLPAPGWLEIKLQ